MRSRDSAFPRVRLCLAVRGISDRETVFLVRKSVDS